MSEPCFFFIPYQEAIESTLNQLSSASLKNQPRDIIPFSEFSALAKAKSIGTSANNTQAVEAEPRALWIDLFPVARELGVDDVVSLSEELLEQLYGTTQPTREMILLNAVHFEDLEPGQGVYAVVYANGQPTEIMFASCSDDDS